MDLQRRRHKDMVGKCLDRNLVGEHRPGHGDPHCGVGFGHASERKPRGIRHIDAFGQLQQTPERRIERGIGGKAAAVERRHRMLAGALAFVVSRKIDVRKPVLQPVLAGRNARQKPQERRQLMLRGQFLKAFRSGLEQCRRIGKPCEWRLGNLADRHRIVPGRPNFTH